MNDRKDLKIQALLEKISELTANYENKIAELRIDLTLQNNELNDSRIAIEALKEQLVEREDSVVQAEEASDDSSN